MEAVILKTVWVGTIHYTSGIMKSRIENLYNIFDNYEARSHSPFRGVVVHNRVGSMVELEGYYKIFKPEENSLKMVSSFESEVVLNPVLLLSIIEIDGEEMRSIEYGGTSVVVEKFWKG